MDATVQCPNCNMSLRVPRNASGHPARCPACGGHFIVPCERDLLEETFSAWIEQDVDQVRHMLEDADDLDLFAEQDDLAAPQGSGIISAVETEETERDSEPLPPPPPRKPLSRTPPELRRWRSATAHDGDGSDDGSDIPSDGHPTHEVADAPADVQATESPEPAESSVPSPPPKVTEPVAEYPQELLSVEPTPRLIVQRCDHMGIRFAFDSRWLRSVGFRASMPMRCVFSGETNRAQLIARPLVFLDRCRLKNPSLDQLSALHEHRVLADRSPRELIEAMGHLEEMDHPFHLPMPYYVSTRYAHTFLYCNTHDRSEGGVTCEVLVPGSACAIDWLARVNGVCGVDYELLQRDVSMLHGEKWRELSDPTRQRLNNWCKMRPREAFRFYLNDADFGKQDAGRAGLVLTDQRLIFCKYHRRGQVRLDDPNAVILAEAEGKFVNLYLQVGDTSTRMVKLRWQDLSPLAKELEGSEGVRLMVQD